MVYFIDTNIAIGYSIFPDKFHNPCKNFIINTVDDIYWSNGVYKEFKDKFNELLNIVEDFLDIISHNLNNRYSPFDNKDNFASFILEKTKDIELDNIKKSKLIDIFWEDCMQGFSNDINQLNEKFEDFSLYVPDLFDENKNQLIQKLICHDCDIVNYKNYPDLKNLLKSNGIHCPDYKFVIDAHDLGKNHTVIFVSADAKMINAIIENNILNQLYIEDFKILT